MIDAIWTQERATHHGAHFDFDEIEVFPKPLQKPRPPIWIGGRSAAAQERAGRLADGWMPSQCQVSIFDEGVKWVRSTAATAGRPAPEDFGINAFMAVGRTDEEAFGYVDQALGKRFNGRAALLDATIAGSPETVIARIRQYAVVGLNLVDLKFVPLTLEANLAQMELVAREVMPAFA